MADTNQMGTLLKFSCVVGGTFRFNMYLYLPIRYPTGLNANDVMELEFDYSYRIPI